MRHANFILHKSSLGWAKRSHGNQSGSYFYRHKICTMTSIQRTNCTCKRQLQANKNDSNVLCNCEAQCFESKVIISLSDVVHTVRTVLLIMNSACKRLQGIKDSQMTFYYDA